MGWLSTGWLVLGQWTPLASNPGDVPSPPLQGAILTEDGDFLMTEDGDYLVKE